MKKFIKIIYGLIKHFFVISLTLTLIYAVLPIFVTPVMIGRTIEGFFEGKIIGIHKTWKNFDNISPNVLRAFIGAEDGRFLTHNGIDWRAVKVAERYNEIHKGNKKRGASTITMQTAKNAFLWHSRIYIRKALELYFTFLIEPLWGKKRILEVYANIVEFGDGIYGVEAASSEVFGKSSESLTRRQSALLAAVLPNPHRWSPAKPTAYINRRVAWIQGRLGVALPKEYKTMMNDFKD
jgi:monofunctional biosynthetic peptidoglycan transglycosylase